MPTVTITPEMDLVAVVRKSVLCYWRGTGQWPSIRQTAKSLGFGVKRITALVQESPDMEIWEVWEDREQDEIMVQCVEVDSELGPYWLAWQQEQLRINTI